MYFSNSQAIRVLPTPASPSTTISAGRWVSSQRVEELLEHPELAVASDQRRLETVRSLRTADGCDDGAHGPQRDRLDLAAQAMAADVDVGDRRGGEQPRRLVDPDLARCRNPWTREAVLTASPATMPCCCAPTRDRHLTGDDADAHGQPRHVDLLAEGSDAPHQLETGTHRPLGVVLVRRGHAPHRHHGVADELLHAAAVAADDPAALVEVRRLQLLHVLLVAGLSQRGEADEVPEQHAGDAAGDGRPPGGGGGLCGRRRGGRGGRSAGEAELERQGPAPPRTTSSRARPAWRRR